MREMLFNGQKNIAILAINALNEILKKLKKMFKKLSIPIQSFEAYL